MPPPFPARTRLAVALACAGFAAAAGWLLVRVRLGLDFTDEMQYYGEIAGLVRTGRFFQDDLFLQQLGYLWVAPFFKLHAWLYPDLDYFVVFGRALCVAAYAATGALLWRATARGGFGLPARITALGVFAAWIPFQLLAFSYNSLAYLALVALTALWLGRGAAVSLRGQLAAAAVLTVLTVSYPPAGLVLIAVAAAELAARHGRGPALQLVALTAAGGALTAAAIFATHGRVIFEDVLISLRFSSGFSGGQMFRDPAQIAWLLALCAIGGALTFRLRRRSAPRPSVQTSRPRATLLAVGAWAVLAGLSVSWRAGYFVPVLFLGLLAALVLLVRPDDGPLAGDLGVLGLILGAVFAVSGGDGFLNASTGLAAVLPFLALVAARQTAERAAAVLPATVVAGAWPAVSLVFLLNGAAHPYRDQRGWSGFGPVEGIPAFAGLLASPTKLETMARLRELSDHGAWRGRRVFVAGPHPWLYFATGGTPATCMFFLHFTADADREDVYELIAERMFRDGPPDAIFLTNPVPPAIGRPIGAWSEAGVTERNVLLPLGFIRRHRREVSYDFAGQLYLLARPSAPPAAPPP